MRLLLLAMLSAALANGCAHKVVVPAGSSAVAADQRAQGPVPVAAIWTDVGPGIAPPAPPELRRLIVGVWSDGTIVWSADHVAGGQPYSTASIDPERVDKLLQDLDAEGLFGDLRQVNFGPDSGYTVVAAQAGSKRQWLGSWHEPAPSSPSIAVTQDGMVFLESGQARPKVSAEYQHFLDVWSKARHSIEGLVPARGQPLGALDERVFRIGEE